MILKYGTYTCAQDTLTLAVVRDPLRNEFGMRYGYRERWTITGELQGADSAALTTAIAAMQTAFASDGQDLCLYLNDGMTKTVHELVSATAIGGVRILAGPEFPDGDGAEYAVIRTYKITAEAEYEDEGADELLGYQETITVTGTGGPRRVVLVPLVGTPIMQQTSTATPVEVTQDGYALGLTDYPAANACISPNDENKDRRMTSNVSPDKKADANVSPDKKADAKYRHYRTSWHYEMTFTQAPSESLVSPTLR
jgi:hypothetical protein